MKLLIVAALIGLSASGALPGHPYQPNPYQPNPYQGNQYRPRSGAEGRSAILRSDAQLNERDFYYAYETENGIQAQGSGREADGIEAQGGYSYVGDDGQVYSVQYTAGHGGFQVQGNHLPTPPPVPAEIARALSQNAQDEARGIYDDGSYHDGKYANDAAAGSGIFAARSFSTPQPIFRAAGHHY